MHEELQQAVDSGKLTTRAAEALERLAPGAYCLNKSWGFGQVKDWSLLTDQIIIDFHSKKGHSMQLQYAADSLTFIPEGHVLARKAINAAAVKAEAAEDPVSFVRGILNDYNGKVTMDQIAAALAPEVFDASGFKKWWDAAKKKLKADGHFQLPAKKTDPIILLDTPSSPAKGLLERFRVARHLKEQVATLDQITKTLADFADEVHELQPLAAQIEDVANKSRKLQSAHALELLIARDEILAHHTSLTASPGAPGVPDILRGEQPRLAELFVALPASKQRKAIEHFPAAFEDKWVDVALRLILQSNARLVVEISRLLEKEGKQEDLRFALTRWVSERSASSEILIWLCKERGGAFKELFGPDLLGCVYSALERDQLAEKRGSRLHDLLLDDRELLGDLLAKAAPDQVRDSMRRLLMTPVFDDLNKRSLMARIVKLYPEMQALITGGEPTRRDNTLTVSWASLEKRKEEFEDLKSRQIPQNIQDIAIAASYGDLRENFEFKSAKEQQRVLQRKHAEFEIEMDIARGTNFENPDTNVVSIGTVVTLQDDAGKQEIFSILGAWDSAPELGIVSYKAAIGQSLLGKKIGDKVNVSTEAGESNSVEIVSIKPFTDLDVLANKIHLLSKPAAA